ncbi:hypothetical protein [Ruania rhizosphaerae]|uniref:hypothetical protein n=1 Tax=Ruania rhizosphaerae TaxID=1840413 RepID=UPI0013584124|nr:hypothetical protein [Ruania rhizosphaerae]
MSDFLIGAGASALTGLGLWAFLPRGVALTRRYGNEPETWILQNISPVPVRIISVEWQGVDTMTGDRILWQAVPVGAQHDAAVRIVPAEDDRFYALTLEHERWSGFVVRPGDSLHARVLSNRTVRIRYRREGWTGLFERREIRIDGGT